MKYTKLFTIILFTLLLNNCFAAMVTVSIEPLQKTSYAFEEAKFKITIFNNEPIEVNDFQLKIIGEGLKIYENQKEHDYREFPPMSLLPNSKIEKTITFKATENIDKEYTILLEYGVGKKEFQTKTTTKIKKNQIEFNPQLNKFNSTIGEKNTILINLENKSIKPIKNVSIKLKENKFIENKSKPIEFTEFIPNQKITNTPIEFIIIKKIVKPIDLILELKFTDEIGEHTIEKQIELKPKEKNDLIIMTGIAVLLTILLIYSYIQSKPKTKKTENKKEKTETLEETKQKIINSN